MVVNRHGNSTRRAPARAPMRAMYNLLILSILAAGIFGCDWLNPPEELTVENLSNNSGYSLHPQVACGPGGNTVVVWGDNTSGYENIVMVEKQAGGEWSEQMTVSQDSSGSRYPDACFDSLGNLHLVYQRYSPGRWTIMYRCRDRDGTWAQEETVGGTWAVVPRLAVGQSQKLHVVYVQGSTLAELRYATRDSSGHWLTEVVPTVGERHAGSACVLSDGRVVVVWSAQSTLRVYGAVRDTLGVWSGPTQLADADYAWADPALCSVGDTAFVVHMVPKVGLGGNLVLQTYCGTWSEPDLLASVEDGTHYSLASTPTGGELVLAMTSLTSGTALVYSRSLRWRLLATAAASQLTDNTSIAVGSLGVVHVAWPTYNPNNQMDIMHVEFQSR